MYLCDNRNIVSKGIVMNKKDCCVIFCILITSLALPVLLNWLLSIDGFIPSIFSKRDWFGFWTTYSTGVFALIIGYLAISFGNKNSEKAIMQQTQVFLRQESEKIKSEIANEIKSHNRLNNIFKHSSTFVAMDYDDIPGMTAKVMENRSLLRERLTSWGFVKQLYLSSPNLKNLVSEYDSCWSETAELLDKYLVLQMELLKKNQEIEEAAKRKGISDELLRLLTQKRRASNNQDCNEIEEEINRVSTSIDELQAKHDMYRKDLSELIQQVIPLQDAIVQSQDTLFSASLRFLTQLNEFTFLRK